jgi:hypothetical protein
LPCASLCLILTPKLRTRPPIEGFRLDPRFLVEFGSGLIPSDLVRLRTQVLGHSIPYGRFTSPPNLSSRAQAVWEIHGGIEEVDFSVFTSGCSIRGLADCPPVAHGPSAWCVFFACLSSSCEFTRRSFEVSKFRCGVFVGPSVQRGRTVRTEGSDRPWVGRTVRLETADCPRGTSCSRTVRGQGADRPLFRVRYWMFCCLFRTVRPRVADHPPRPCGLSAW